MLGRHRDAGWLERHGFRPTEAHRQVGSARRKCSDAPTTAQRHCGRQSDPRRSCRLGWLVPPWHLVGQAWNEPIWLGCSDPADALTGREAAKGFNRPKLKVTMNSARYVGSSLRGLITSLILRFIRSTCPSVEGGWGVIRRCLIRLDHPRANGGQISPSRIMSKRMPERDAGAAPGAALRAKCCLPWGAGAMDGQLPAGACDLWRAVGCDHDFGGWFAVMPHALTNVRVAWSINGALGGPVRTMCPDADEQVTLAFSLDLDHVDGKELRRRLNTRCFGLSPSTSGSGSMPWRRRPEAAPSASAAA